MRIVFYQCSGSFHGLLFKAIKRVNVPVILARPIGKELLLHF